MKSMTPAEELLKAIKAAETAAARKTLIQKLAQAAKRGAIGMIAAVTQCPGFGPDILNAIAETERGNFTALIVAADAGQNEALRFLIGCGADTAVEGHYTGTKERATALLAAVFSRNPTTVKILVAHNFNPEGWDSKEALTAATLDQQYAIVDILLDSGISPHVALAALETSDFHSRTYIPVDDTIRQKLRERAGGPGRPEALQIVSGSVVAFAKNHR